MARSSGALRLDHGDHVATQRISYEELSPAVRAAIEDKTGPVIKARSVEVGLNSSVAARLDTEADEFFVKALPTDHRWVWTQLREAEMAPFVRAVAPALVARVVEDGWDVLVFEAVHGHHADYAPGSPDLPIVARLLRTLGELPAPGIELRRAEQRLRDYVSREEDLRYFAGDHLLHTDWNASNVIVGRGARIVDWGWATHGAAWLDAGYWVIWLIAAGHEPCDAESWARQVPAWRTAPSEGIAAFAFANARLWAEIGGADPDAWTTRLVTAAARWRDYRTSAA